MASRREEPPTHTHTHRVLSVVVLLVLVQHVIRRVTDASILSLSNVNFTQPSDPAPPSYAQFSSVY